VREELVPERGQWIRAVQRDRAEVKGFGHGEQFDALGML
jgi:hypothetical protein